jgi:anti-anti-sigma factor
MTQPDELQPTTEPGLPIFRCDSSREADRLVIRPAGELDVYNARRLRDSFEALDDGVSRQVVVDLSQVRFIDSSCLALLVWASNRAREAGRSLVLRRPTRSVVMALAASGLLRTFRYDDAGGTDEHPWPSRLPTAAKSTVRSAPRRTLPIPRRPQVTRLRPSF